MERRKDNFRAHYLSTLGFQNAELKNSLESIFKSQIIDTKQIKKICKRFELPAEYRAVVWKVMLGVLPIYREAWEYVTLQHEEQYEDVKRAAMLVRPSTFGPRIRRENEAVVEVTPGSEVARKLALIYRVQHYLLDDCGPITEKDSDDMDDLLNIAHVFCSVCGCDTAADGKKSEAEAYWCYYNLLTGRNRTYGHQSTAIYHQINILSRLLEIQAPDILRHLNSIGASVESFAYPWFRSYFSCSLPIRILPRVWDGVICVTSDFLACMGCSLLIHFKEKIFDIAHPRELAMFLLNLPKLDVDKVFLRAQEMLESEFLEDSSKDGIKTLHPH